MKHTKAVENGKEHRMTKTVEVRIKGISAILMHRFPMEPIVDPPIEKRSKENQAELSAYRHPETDELYVPGVCVRSAMVGAGTYSKGKGRATLQKPIAACLQVMPEYLLLGTHDFVIDSRPIVNPSTRGRIIRHRPRIDEWELSFEMEFDDALVTEGQVRTILDDAGKRVGILDYRPANKGPFGRFVVTHWEMNSKS